MPSYYPSPPIVPTTSFTLVGTLPAGASTLYTCPAGHVATVSDFSFSNSAPWGVTMRYVQVNPAATSIIYTFTNVAAGDTVYDSRSYELKEGDYIEVTMVGVGAYYFMKVLLTNKFSYMPGVNS